MLPTDQAITSAAKPESLTRREALKLGTASVPLLALALAARSHAALQKLDRPVRIGMIADLHQDVMHDGVQRISAFANAMQKQTLDAVLQLGDFAYPAEKNREVIDRFNGSHKKPLHVIGNHDTDSGHTKAECLEVWGMPSRYYTTDVAGVQLIVLDGNDSGSPTYKGGYPSYIGEEQLAWLEKQLEELAGPIVVVSHQPLAGPAAVDNAEQVQQLLSKAADKVLLAINGHTHIDAIREVEHVRYLHVNSASYYWMGGDYKHTSYPAEVHESHPYIEYTCPYREALFSTLVIDPESLTITLEGSKSEWVGKSPNEMGLKEQNDLDLTKEVSPTISPRKIERS
ncbi:metallophosphoesterase family protein [Aeoliella mucimassa]|uniref:Calcineurin-like phosphoesterase superfamily domain protein n=1 Tax=Aeoliella mucimassa TaxID=2527972 RepID=A0A518AID6_9BACT|nr:metallophosphoesterase family protein [Aeoliella mucimassa]QDU54470.1 Calcineurin-like phosphoesterase superfamily domain protein [Aeoliella mucimassa]